MRHYIPRLTYRCLETPTSIFNELIGIGMSYISSNHRDKSWATSNFDEHSFAFRPVDRLRSPLYVHVCNGVFPGKLHDTYWVAIDLGDGHEGIHAIARSNIIAMIEEKYNAIRILEW